METDFCFLTKKTLLAVSGRPSVRMETVVRAVRQSYGEEQDRHRNVQIFLYFGEHLGQFGPICTHVSLLKKTGSCCYIFETTLF